MKFGQWTLPRKIAALGLFNAALLVLVLLVFAQLQFGVGLESIAARVAEDHLNGVGNRFRVELDAADGKDAVIARYARQYEADVFLVNPGGHAIFGPDVELPPRVMERLKPRPPGGGRGLGPPPPPFEEGDEPGPPGHPPGRPPRPNPGFEPVTVVGTANPTAYWAVVRIPVVAPDERTRPAMLVFRTQSIFHRKLFFDWRPWAGLTAALLGVSLLCWIPFLRGLARSIGEMDRVTREIARGRFGARVPDSRNDELGDLVRQINVMAVHLDNFVASQRRFLGDVAHELSAPLARIQFALGILERRVEEARHGDIDVLRDEIQEMSLLVNELLSFSKASMDPVDAGGPGEAVKVGEVVRAAAAREAVAAEIRVDDSLAALARRAPLQRAIGNLLRNAQRYAGEHGPIEVAARREGREVTITVSDHGPGLPESALERVFEPFWRPNSSRSRDTGGVGLGLSIVKSCVASCGGTVSCRNRQPAGLEVTIRLAAAPE